MYVLSFKEITATIQAYKNQQRNLNYKVKTPLMALRNSKCLLKRLRSVLKKLQFLTKRVFCSKEKLITNMVYLIKFFLSKAKKFEDNFCL